MQLVYGFVYYFLLIFVALNFSLIIFALKPLRKLLHKIQTRFKNLFNNQYISYLINFSFAIIFIIMADSVRTFYLVNNQISTRTHSPTQMTTPSSNLASKGSTPSKLMKTNPT